MSLRSSDVFLWVAALTTYGLHAVSTDLNYSLIFLTHFASYVPLGIPYILLATVFGDGCSIITLLLLIVIGCNVQASGNKQ